MIEQNQEPDSKQLIVPEFLIAAEPEIAVQQLSQSQLIWRRFRRHRIALVGAIMLGVLLLFAIFPAVFAGSLPKPLTPAPNTLLAKLAFPFIGSPSYNQLPAWGDWGNAPYTDTGPQGEGQPPQLWDSQPGDFPLRFLLGTDDEGRSIWGGIVWGARVSLTIGILSALLASIVGIIVGALAGYFGGILDALLMALTNIFLTLPFLPIILVASAIFGQGSMWLIIIIFTVFGWMQIARLLRSYFLTFREREFVEAARAVGASPLRIILVHILPNSLGPVIVATTLNAAGFIVAEAAIDFLGFGVDPSTATWGTILANAQGGLLYNPPTWWTAVFPGLFILLAVLSINFLGDGLRDALDVRSDV